MSTPNRIQRKRTAGWKMPENTVYVGRPTKWGNPFSLKSHICVNYAKELAIRNYKTFLERNPELIRAAQRDLKGKNLACWCKEGSPCHADVLLELANK